MIGHPRHERLQDYVDGLLPPARRDRLDRHLAGCGRCRDEVEHLRTLLQEAERLPRAIEPRRDLWGGIAARIEAEQVVELAAARAVLESERREASPSAYAWPTRRLMLAAAAALLVLVSSGVTLLLVGGGTEPAAPIAVRNPTGARTVSHIEQGYAHPVAQLRASLEQGRGELRPETVAVIEENLRIVDQAIADATEALASDPANVRLTQSLEFAYRQKLELLQRAVRLQRT